MTILFVLQNAWRRGAHSGEIERHHEAAWTRLLWQSQTGRRLREMIPEGIDDLQVGNASLRVGNTSSSTFPADPALMRFRLLTHHPDVTVLCGKVAQQLAPVVEECEYTCILSPHPAWRLLTKERTASIRTEIELALRDSFPVTDDLIDAPDGAKVNGYERVGDAWERIRHER